MTHADCLNCAAVERRLRLWACGLAQKRAFQSRVRPLVGAEMAVFAAAGIPHLVLDGGHRSRKREKCYSAVVIIEQIGSCRIISDYGYSSGV